MRRFAMALAVLAASVPPAARFAAGPPGAVVHVRWQDGISAEARERLEDRFRLRDGRAQDAQTWRYDLIDPSTGNIEALVSHPAAVDTHQIDRAAFAPDAAAPRTVRRQRWPNGDVFVRAADVTAIAVILLAAFMAAPAAFARPRRAAARATAAAGNIGRQLLSAAGRPLSRWIPELDAGALGAFRIALGCGFIWIAWTIDVRWMPLERQRHFATPDLSFVHGLAASPRACDLLEWIMLAAAVCFTAGVRARAAYAAFVLTFGLYTLVTLEGSSAHDLGLPLVTFLGWLAVPWDRPVSTGQERGFAIWWPGLTLGAALFAAAYAKLARSGVEWITGGAVKYHFVSDAANAPIDWGLWVASHHEAAVLFAFAAILLEAAFIVNIFMRTPAARMAAGAAGVALFLGLYLFQGIFWRPWLVLLLAFAPWGRLNGRQREAALPGRASRDAVASAQVIAVVGLVLVQLYASAAAVEAEPLVSSFPMYSSTFASPRDYDTDARLRLTRVVEARAEGRDVTAAFRNLPDGDRDLLVVLAEDPDGGEALLAEDDGRPRATLCEDYRRVLGGLPAEIALALERRTFDWENGRFNENVRIATSPVALRTLCQEDLARRR